MIKSTLYSSERLNSTPQSVTHPVKLFKEIASSVPKPVVCEGLVFALDDNERLTAYDEITGTQIWQSEVSNLRNVLPVVYTDRILIEDVYTNEGVVLSLRNGCLIDRLDVIGASAYPGWAMKDERLFTVVSKRSLDIKEILSCRKGEKFEIEWSYNEFSFTEYAVSDDYILLNDDKGSLACLNLDGVELWKMSAIDTGLFASQIEIDELPKSKPGLSNTSKTLGYPIIFENRIGVVPMLDNHLVGIELKTGSIVWKTQVQSASVERRQGYCNEIYCLSNEYIQTFHMDTGEQTKKIQIDSHYISESLDTETTSFTQFTISETHIYAASSSMQYFSAISLESGKVDWTFKPVETIADIDQPYVSGGRVYFPCLRKMYIFEGV